MDNANLFFYKTVMGHIFWDFDGTLVQSSPLWRRAMLEALETVHPGHAIDMPMLSPLVSVGFPWHSDHAHGITTSDLWWTRMEAKFAKDFKQLGFSDEVAEHSAMLIKQRILDPNSYNVFEDVRDVLGRLSKQGWKHVILSNNHPDLEELVIALGMREHFASIVTSGEVGFEKPRPEIFEYALNEVEAQVSESWMIGDNPVADVQGAENIGLRAILVRSNSFAPRKADDLHQAEKIIVAEQ